jgi:broad specificity phosphatase PhoE
MQICSIDKLIEDLEKLCPNGTNIKIVIRHSMKQDIKDGAAIEQISEAPLTTEGIKTAELLGESLNMKIGTISSGYRYRCLDTCQGIINGFNKKHAKYTQDIFRTKMLESPHCKNVPEERETWEKLGMEGLFDCFAKDIEAPGFFGLKTSVNKMLNYIFQTGNKKDTIDIFCTHGLHIAMLLLYFNKSDCNFKDALFDGKGSWPLMLESMFLWGNNNNFNMAWRGEIKKIKL